MQKKIENPALPSDTVALMGKIVTWNKDLPIYTSFAFTRKAFNELAGLCGIRADWIILFEEVSEHKLRNEIIPFLCTPFVNEKKRSYNPVIYDRNMKVIWPINEQKP